MRKRCRVCGEHFCPDDETIELISEGWITADSVNICDECFEMIQSSYYSDQGDMISDTDPGL
jgi:hypothetical protein